MFKKILIANRGEIACRVAATARRLGVQTVAVYSDADAQAKHVAACDEAIHIGGSAPKDSYLQWARIIEAAQATGAQAIHPGYGFLSENAEFARACAAAGLVFIGPPAAAIEAMGLKAESKRLMEQAGVPLVPGYHGADQDPALLQCEADRIGYPVLIKASAGGGGKGMRVVERSADFAAALASCQREASNSFGDDAVLIEKYVQRPRHIEIQVFADRHGHCVYLHERDCSVQRRHQKVLEEAPAPGLTPALRQQMGQAAVAAAQAVGYVGAGTVEFIVEQVAYDQPESMSYFFMEMNTRLQVEHPVTEAITGIDLVEWQLRVAAGEALPLQQHELRIQGHAIEARICAENPEQQFLPATGTLLRYRKPPHCAFERGPLRFDDGVREGDAISPFYDSMVAKLIVHADTREQALARLDAALAQTHIVGLTTNVQFLRQVLRSPSFEQARLDTALIPREAALLFGQDPLGLPLAVAAATAQTLLDERALENTDPFSRRDGWRSHPSSETVRRIAFEYQGQPVAASLTYQRDGGLHLSVEPGSVPATGADGAGAVAGGAAACAGPLRFHALPAGSAWALELGFAGLSSRASVYVQGEQMHVFSPHGAAQIVEIDRLAHAGDSAPEGGRLSAPMPGKVLSFCVSAGEVVKKGQPLALMEAMKMEHTIAAPADGTVAELLYAPGDQVAEGAELLRFTQSGITKRF
ncbi:acetyl/propionyl/methylcrotonyl-CoA carboxylase subunit alpha [Serpentinimonas maccroryi]|uniref:acetyl/propionyl/methylcrotonyl-CoA carboxylase subunit alpha n=1 Tax=Serpentinimonas maccroryi TaxID=1458426 RepID=UPI0020340B2B|nr:acetyl/propionyl/methylcrotonyl-CoA carboxylase subunit alpha [Serpentinimonas maccroryi]MCM2479704.1 acetyl/propionyl/methylcrotonyl-CoA carboxylase subunit alpha [Serpentinimonas maccroryi]